MKKNKEQLQQEVAEIRRFVDGDSRDVAIKARVLEEPDEFGDAFWNARVERYHRLAQCTETEVYIVGNADRNWISGMRNNYGVYKSM